MPLRNRKMNHEGHVLFERRANLDSRVNRVLPAQNGAPSVYDVRLAASASRGDVSLPGAPRANVRSRERNIPVD
jgi:hypothetical protein